MEGPWEGEPMLMRVMDESLCRLEISIVIYSIHLRPMVVWPTRPHTFRSAI